MKTRIFERAGEMNVSRRTLLRGSAGIIGGSLLPAMIIIDHDMDSLFELVERVTVLQEGRVLLDGTPEEIKTNAAVQEAYLGGVHGEIAAWAQSTTPCFIAARRKWHCRASVNAIFLWN